MSDFFDDSHVTDVGLEGSAGPSVSIWDMAEQAIRQQYRVDSARALDEELRTRWLESLQGLRAAGLSYDEPIDPLMYRGFARFVRDGTPVTMPTVEGSGYGARINYDAQQPSPEFEEMHLANEAIRRLNNPDIRTFEQILEEVSGMQRGVEEQTASMSERAGWSGFFFGELPGAIIGSFTPRDPLNIITAPIGAGRTIATRIGTDMLVAAGVVTATEFGDVAPNRALAGLPERDPLFNIAAATFGAGVIRGALIEPAGYALRRLRERPAVEEIDFDRRDSQLRQMFEADTPTARAGAQALDDMTFIERNNPYGEGQAAQARFLAELREVQRVMGGEPMTAIARVLPPIPFEQLRKAADFEIVREQSPTLYARLSQAEARLAELSRSTSRRGGYDVFHETPATFDRLERGHPGPYHYGESLDSGGLYFSYARDWGDAAKNPASKIAAGESVFRARVALDNPLIIKQSSPTDLVEKKNVLARAEAEGHDGVVFENELVVFNPDRVETVAVFRKDKKGRVTETLLRKQRTQERRTANKEYQTAYRAVEAEAVRLREQHTRLGAIEQGKAANILTVGLEGRPFIGPMLHHDYVKELTERINAFNDTLDETAVAAFVRQMEGEEVLGREVWQTEDGRIDIGLREPVDPDFRFDIEDGDITVAQAMRDLQDDADLDEAMRTCLR